jgi:hypothetical protein
MSFFLLLASSNFVKNLFHYKYLSNMSNNEKYITDLHQENKQWLEAFKFYKEEIKVLRNRLGEVSAKNSASDVKIRVSHLENQFIINDEQVDELSHAVKESEALVQASINANPTATDHRKLPDHEELRNKINKFEELFKSLRAEANEFFAKVM